MEAQSSKYIYKLEMLRSSDLWKRDTVETQIPIYADNVEKVVKFQCSGETLIKANHPFILANSKDCKIPIWWKRYIVEV